MIHHLSAPSATAFTAWGGDSVCVCVCVCVCVWQTDSLSLCSSCTRRAVRCMTRFNTLMARSVSHTSKFQTESMKRRITVQICKFYLYMSAQMTPHELGWAENIELKRGFAVTQCRVGQSDIHTDIMTLMLLISRYSCTSMEERIIICNRVCLQTHRAVW